MYLHLLPILAYLVKFLFPPVYCIFYDRQAWIGEAFKEKKCFDVKNKHIAAEQTYLIKVTNEIKNYTLTELRAI